MNQPNTNPLAQYESQLKEIFTLERLPAILSLLNTFRPPYGRWIKENEFETLVHIAKIQALDDLQVAITNYVLSTNQLPKPHEKDNA